MIEVALQEIAKSFGANSVLEKASLELKTGERIGLVGRNGTGKTTIFKIIANMETYNGGTVSIRKGTSIGYLAQIPQYPANYSVEDVLNHAFKEAFKIKDKMKALEGDMAHSKGTDLEKIMRVYGEMQIAYEGAGGYEIEEKVSKVCTGLKINDEFRRKIFSNLSGGEQTRVVLAMILLQSPDVLLLDEPSNHLDLQSIEWLENYLRDYQGSVMIISHDRYFLDRVVEKIYELEGGCINTYHGNYSYYLEEKQRRFEEAWEIYKNQQKKIQAMEESIKRFRVWGAKRDSVAMYRKAKIMERKLEKVDKLDKPIADQADMKLQFSGSTRSGKEVVVIENLSKAFGDKIILQNLDFHVQFAERVAIVGKNGTGKSTLLKIILQEYKEDAGLVSRGSRVKMGYLEQNITFEHPESTILETFMTIFEVSEGEARNKLAKFLFWKDDVFKKVHSLSGGEKSRLKLCILMNKDINCLILDEPTNHLDIESREILEEALKTFEGTIIFISHDRYFINKLAQRIVELEDKQLTNYLGGYDYYKRKKLEQEEKLQEIHAIKSKEKKKKVTKKVDPEKHREKELEKLEIEIAEYETLLEEKNKAMEACGTDYDQLNKIFVEKEKIQAKLDDLLEAWVELS